LLSSHRRIDSYAPKNAIVFFGDSHTQGLLTQYISTNTLNYGIGGDTSLGLLTRLPLYVNSINNARLLVIAVGTNDLKWRTPPEFIANLKKILSLLTQKTNVPILLQAIFLINENNQYMGGKSNIEIIKINRMMQQLVSMEDSVFYLNINDELSLATNHILRDKYNSGDGVHLNTLGYLLWIKALKNKFILMGHSHE